MSPASPSPTYETVEALINRSRVNGDTMEYVFRCPVTGFEATGTAPIAQPSHAPMKQFGPLSGLVSPRFEAEAAADRVIPFSGTVTHYATSARRLFRGEKDRRAAAGASPAQQQDGVQALALTAFATVASQFAWDGARWVKA